MTATSSTIDADGWLTLTAPVAVKTGITVAAPPSWLADHRFQILDQHALIALNRRIARLRTSGSMPVIKTMDTIYRKHASLCRYDAQSNRVELPTHIKDAFAPLPCPVTIANEDGHLTIRKHSTP